MMAWPEDEGADEEPDDETVIVDASAPSGDADDDDTISVSDGPVAADDDATVIVGLDVRDVPGALDAEATVIVERTMPPNDDATVLVERSAPRDEDADATVLVERSGSQDLENEEDQDETVIVAQAVPVDAEATEGGTGGSPDAAADEDSTIAVRPSPASTVAGGGASAAVKPRMDPPRVRRRGELRPAPVPSGFGGVPIVASGAGAVSTYRTRSLVPPPEYVAIPAEAPAPKRILGGVESVARRSRRSSVVAIASFAASFVLIGGALVWAVQDLVGF